MEIEVTGRTEKALLDREEIELDIMHRGESTPSEDAVRKKLAAELDLDPLTIAVDGIYSSSGVGRSRGVVTVHEEQVIEEMDDEDAEESEEEADEDSAEEEVADEEPEDGAEDADDEDEPEEDADETDDEAESEDAAADEDEDEKEDDS